MGPQASSDYSSAPQHDRPCHARLAIDKRISLDINDSTQAIRMCSERKGLPPLLIVQAGPGFPSLPEAAKFRKRLNLEHDFLVIYWDQRGCGRASRRDTRGVTFEQQVDDLLVVLHWLNIESSQPVTIFGISIGATYGLLAAEREPSAVRAVVAISPDSNTATSDASVSLFLKKQESLLNNQRISSRIKTLGDPPYCDPSLFQLRAKLLADLGCIEHGKNFNTLLKETLGGFIRTYGLIGTVKALRNMNQIQQKMLPQLVSFNLFTQPPRLTVPVHFIFGEQDPLVPFDMQHQLTSLISSPGSTQAILPNAGHMLHFDQPESVRSIVLGVLNEA
jgi:pimeloyl-ACP methyl ester carboxylesterase